MIAADAPGNKRGQLEPSYNLAATLPRPGKAGSSQVGVGVIGYGYWGPNLVRNFGEVAGAYLVAVADQRRERLLQAQAKNPYIKVTDQAAELFADPAIDAIVIATPTASHYELARGALQAGKHVLVTKPMASSSGQCESLIELADSRNLTLMVDHTFVYSGSVRKIQELVSSGEIGRLYYYDSVRVNLGLFQHDVNVLWDLAAHDLSIMDFVLGVSPMTVAATGVAHIPGRPANIAYLSLLFEDNLIAHLHVNWLAPVKVRRTLIGGENRMIVYDDLEPSEKVKVYDRGVVVDGSASGNHELLVGYRSGDMWAPKVSLTEALELEAQHFIACINDGTRPLTDGESGARVIRILEAAERSLARRGEPVEPTGGGNRIDPTHRPQQAVPEPAGRG
jgi:predicted dehydrogenase